MCRETLEEWSSQGTDTGESDLHLYQHSSTAFHSISLFNFISLFDFISDLSLYLLPIQRRPNNKPEGNAVTVDGYWEQ